MGCCLFACIGAIWPRLALVFLWLFAPNVTSHAYATRVWPVLGFFFLPTTTLTWALIYMVTHHTPDMNILTLGVLFLAFIHDLGQLGVFRMVEKEPD